jgi:chromosome segregation ATPase
MSFDLIFSCVLELKECLSTLEGPILQHLRTARLEESKDNLSEFQRRFLQLQDISKELSDRCHRLEATWKEAEKKAKNWESRYVDLKKNEARLLDEKQQLQQKMSSMQAVMIEISNEKQVNSALKKRAEKQVQLARKLAHEAEETKQHSAQIVTLSARREKQIKDKLALTEERAQAESEVNYQLLLLNNQQEKKRKDLEQTIQQ